MSDNQKLQDKDHIAHCLVPLTGKSEVTLSKVRGALQDAGIKMSKKATIVFILENLSASQIENLTRDKVTSSIKRKRDSELMRRNGVTAEAMDKLFDEDKGIFED